MAGPLDELLAGAVAEGLPVAPLRAKIQEGRAKKVDPARIQRVVSRLVGLMRRARGWLKQGQKPPPERLVAAVALARMAGVNETEIRNLVKPGAGAGEALKVDCLADLHLRGYRGEQAAALIRATTRHELPVLGRELDRLRLQHNLTRAGAADRMSRALGSNRGSLQRAVKGFRKRPARVSGASGQQGKEKGKN